MSIWPESGVVRLHGRLPAGLSKVCPWARKAQTRALLDLANASPGRRRTVRPVCALLPIPVCAPPGQALNRFRESGKLKWTHKYRS